MNYNEQQLEAIRHREGPMLVLAGPGCGKTSVITGRLEQLIHSGVSPSSILVVTFTRAAAGEMKERFLRSGCEGGTQVLFGTFHSVFYRILRNECHLPADSILSEETKIRLLQQILEGSAEAAFARETAVEVAQEISCMKGNGISSAHYYSRLLPAETFRLVFRMYRDWLRENRKLDFDDIITGTWQLFKSRPEVLKSCQKRFRYILVDEFQDINPLQYALIRLIAEPENNLFIVGDDDQSIYRFRGSDPGMMLSFPGQYSGCRTVRLVQNYRSTPQIIRAAGRVIRRNKKRYAKELVTQQAGGVPVSIRVFDSIWQETGAVAEGIRSAVNAGTPYREIAVLVRTNFGARAIVEKLLSDRIPFEAKQEIPCIFDHFIARDLFAYLAIAAGSSRREDYLRICNRPNRFISRNAFYEPKVRFESLYMYYEGRQWMWKHLEELESGLRALKGLPPYGAISYVRKVIGYEDYLREYALEKKVPFADLTALLDEIAESARNCRSYAAWREQCDAYSLKVKSRQSGQENENSVKISTLHGSKGKEYDIVYILDVNEGVIPYQKAVLEAELEEERRLLYVGMTRARKALSLFAVKERYEKKLEQSSFLRDLTGQK